MTDIIIIGENGDRAIERLIKENLSKTYCITYLKNNNLFRIGKGYELLCFDYRLPILSGINAPLVIAKESALLPPLPESCTAIINAENRSQLKSASECRAYAVDCGLSPACTISFSSESSDTLVVSLNRAITALSGRRIEPLEIPVKKNGESVYTLMSFTALRLLLDDFDSELGRLI